MKKLNIFSIFLLMLLPFLTGCSKDEIIFDSELPRFELRPGYQLLEVIVPQGTLTTDKIYIIGEFNGGMDAVGDPRWQLEKASDTDVKWGVYLNPADFIDGKTLADGYTFYSVEQGEERSLDNEPVIHTEAPALGARLNVLVYRWADYFNKPQNPDEIVHDGYVIYVVDNSEYEELAMYAWGDAEAFGGWPGMKPTGKVTIDGVNYKYFDTGAANEGLNLNLIFNNNGNGKQLPDFNVTLNQDFYLELTPSAVTEFDPSAVVTHDGYAIFVVNNSGWDDLYLYMWGTVNDLNGGWPGMAPTGTQVINGVTYTYFDLGASNCDAGLEEHVILNNGNGKQIDDVVIFNLDRDVYVELSSNRAVEIDPATYIPGTVEPEPEPTPGTEYKIYVQNLTGWSDFYIYAYGDKEIFGGWPGASTTEVKEIGGVSYLVFTVEGSGETENLIFNNNAGTQYDAVTITLDKDYYIVANPDGASIVEPAKSECKIYIEDKTGWKDFYVYAWGDKEIFGSWPGVRPETTETVDGVTYKVLTVEGNGETENLIFNNNDGTQYDAASITLDKIYFIVANPDKAEMK
ncbi:MAG: starch-binding protein [Duncaniella sp.]|nr:starch-binding protein [Bacteroides sp.]MDE6061488.1 starch-binding protein [Duncaniella sp.]MDE7475530.1 starch-binding protein [Duncaniella sp.]